MTTRSQSLRDRILWVQANHGGKMEARLLPKGSSFNVTNTEQD
jgi:hypothetical protein